MIWPRVARCDNLIEHPDLTATPCDGLLKFAVVGDAGQG